MSSTQYQRCFPKQDYLLIKGLIKTYVWMYLRGERVGEWLSQ